MLYLWLIAMGLFVGWLVVPVARQLGYKYGRFGSIGDMLAVLAGTLLGGAVLVWILDAIGLTVSNSVALLLGFVGATAAVFLLMIYAATTAAEPHQVRVTHRDDDSPKGKD